MHILIVIFSFIFSLILHVIHAIVRLIIYLLSMLYNILHASVLGLIRLFGILCHLGQSLAIAILHLISTTNHFGTHTVSLFLAKTSNLLSVFQLLDDILLFPVVALEKFLLLFGINLRQNQKRNKQVSFKKIRLE